MNMLPVLSRVADINGPDKLKACRTNIVWQGGYISSLFAIQWFDEATGFAIVRGEKDFSSMHWRVFKENILMIFPGAKIVYNDR